MYDFGTKGADMLKRLAKYINPYVIANAFFAFFIARGIYTSFLMNSIANRSLWLDEAMLADSFSTRSLVHIFLDGQFAHLQSAPLLWLCFEKILTLFFGNTEYVLRIGSIIGFTGSIALLIFILARFCKSRLPLAAAALFANIPYILQYSNVFKPYIFDGFVSLLVLAAYGLWVKQKLGTRWLALIWAVLIWLAQTGCFIIGGCLFCEFLFSLAHKNRQEIRRTLLLGVVIAVSFVIYYFAWVQRMCSISGMQNYWAFKAFPLIPLSFKDLLRGISLMEEIFRQFDKASLFIMACSGSAIVYSVWKKDKILIGALLGILVALFASYLGMYPVQDRLWCFAYPVFVLVAFATVEGIVHRQKALHAVLAILLIILVAEQNGYQKYSVASNVYWKHEELNLELDYLARHMKPSDPVYVYSSAVPAFRYENGYKDKSFGGGKDNVILGKTLSFKNNSNCKEEIAKILSYPKIWIVSSHIVPERLTLLLQAMHERGYLELASYAYNTPLWWYCESLDDAKTRFTMTVESIRDDGGYKEAVIKIQNTGETYLNNPFDDIYLVNQDNGNLYKINGLIAQGKSTSVTVRYKASETPVFQLRSQYGKIAKDDTITLDKTALPKAQAR